jgi:citrate lyase subunit beta / citryl-CoA lyase
MQISPTVIKSPGRSWLFVPGNNERYMAKAAGCEADVLLLDVEDGVPADDKQRARKMVAACLATPSGKVRFVRVNAWSTGLLPDDLDAIVRPGLDGVCLPKVESPADVLKLAARLAELETTRGLQSGSIRILAAIESARGLLAAYDIAAAHPRVAGLMFGAEDFALDLGLPTNRQHEAADLTYARSALVVAATAAGVMSIDGVYPHLADEDGLRADTRRSVNHGFSGKSTFSPRQLPIIHAVLQPEADEVDFSRRVVIAYDAAAAASAGSAVVDGQLVDLPIVQRARRVLERSELA